MRTRIWLAGFGLIVAVSAGVFAQQGFGQVPPLSGLRLTEPWRPASGKGQTEVIGAVVDIRQVRVAMASVQLRDLNSGLVQQETETNQNGEYLFVVPEPGTYVVEMVLDGGSIVALSNAGSVARYETLQTVVQLPGRWNASARSVVMEQSMTDFVGMSSAATMTAATLTIAAGQNITPVDAGEPVSP